MFLASQCHFVILLFWNQTTEAVVKNDKLMHINNFFCFVFLLMHDMPSSSAEVNVIVLEVCCTTWQIVYEPNMYGFFNISFLPFSSEWMCLSIQKERDSLRHSQQWHREEMYIYSSLLSTRASPRFNFVGNNIASLRLQTKKPKGMRTTIDKISRVPTKHSTWWCMSNEIA